jgi:hypothetical protein
LGGLVLKGLKDCDLVKVKRISPDDGSHYFYGYYDNPALTPDDRMHLYHRVAFMDRMPVPGDESEVGWIDTKTGEFRAFGRTPAWNFQQGSMLRWLGGHDYTAVYNSWNGQYYQTIVQNVITGEKRTLPHPVANVSPDGKWGIVLNFNRIYDFRPGYGYCNIQDPWKNIPVPEDDGLSLMDMETGETHMLFSYAKMEEVFADRPEYRGRKIVINHAAFNQTSDRFLFLVRYFPEPGGEWETALGTSDLKGNIYKLRGYTYASHYFWKDGKTLLIYADGGEGPGLYELTDQTQEYKVYDKNFFHQDIHCSYSPDRQFIIGDGYADEESYRPLFLYHIASRRGMVAGRFYSRDLGNFDIRCDLHGRWMHDGKRITVDSIHEGFRGLYTVDLSEAMDFLKSGQ